MTQQIRLLNYLMVNKTINPIQAWTECGCYRLADIIYKLRKQGLNITMTKIDVMNKFNEPCSFARYELVSD